MTDKIVSYARYNLARDAVAGKLLASLRSERRKPLRNHEEALKLILQRKVPLTDGWAESCDKIGELLEIDASRVSSILRDLYDADLIETGYSKVRRADSMSREMMGLYLTDSTKKKLEEYLMSEEPERLSFDRVVEGKGRLAKSMLEAYLTLTKSHTNRHFEDTGRYTSNGKAFGLDVRTLFESQEGGDTRIGISDADISSTLSYQHPAVKIYTGELEASGNPREISNRLQTLGEILRFYQGIITDSARKNEVSVIRVQKRRT